MARPKGVKWHCKRCTGEVIKNYDHVGDCAKGECSGTFKHLISLVNNHRCDLAFDDLTHVSVGSSYIW